MCKIVNGSQTKLVTPTLHVDWEKNKWQRLGLLFTNLKIMNHLVGKHSKNLNQWLNN